MVYFTFVSQIVVVRCKFVFLFSYHDSVQLDIMSIMKYKFVILTTIVSHLFLRPFIYLVFFCVLLFTKFAIDFRPFAIMRLS